MDKGAGVQGQDIELERLAPLQERQANKTGYSKILSSIKAVGLIEPLCVYEERGKYVILDGYLRYRACRELGLTTVPCLVLPTKEAYTCNRMINHLSAVQESRMLNQSLGTLEEETIAKAFGLTSFKHRIKNKLLGELHPRVVEAFDKKCIPLRVCAQELTLVKPEYQAVILKEMEVAGDFSAAFIRTLIMRAPDHMRSEKKRRLANWNRGTLQKKKLAGKLGDVERQRDFYSGLYRKFVSDLMKLCIYVRQLITNRRISEYVKSHHPDMFDRFQGIVFETAGKKARSSD